MANSFDSNVRWDQDEKHDAHTSTADQPHDDGQHEDQLQGEAHEGDHEHEGQWTIQDSMDYHLGKDHLIGHVQDSTYFEIPSFDFRGTRKIEIPNPMKVLGISEETPIVPAQNDFFGKISFQPTKFVVLELFAALIIAAAFITLGRMIKSGNPPRGRFWNMLETVVVYIRDDIARPAIGTKDATRFLPFLWTVFFFVLILNLMGMVPGLGAATGSISVTTALALYVFVLVLYTGMKKMGVAGFWLAQAPHIDLSGPLKYILIPMVWAIEVFGLFIKHMVLSVRLFANMFAGHMVLAVFVAFIGVVWNTLLAWGVVPAVIGASLGVNLLELLVAFIQAYVFTFLSALFIGAAIHPH